MDLSVFLFVILSTKIISKVITKKLKQVFSYFILEEQLGHVKGRKNLDGIMVAHEVVDLFHKTKKIGILIKLNLSMEFNKLSQTYIYIILLGFQFSYDWSDQIFSLISSTFSILVNNSLSSTSNPSIGITQVDPLSPFIFILAIEDWEDL